MDSIFLKKLLLKTLQTDRKNYIFLHSEWQENLVKFYLKETTSNSYYKGQLEAKDFEEAAAELEIPLAEFRNECKHILTSSIGTPGFEIELDRSSDDGEVLRVNKNEEFCIQYLEIKLSAAEPTYEMLDIALNLIENSNNENETQKTNETLAALVDQVEQVLQEKEQWKEKMLKKFLILLNAKKEKISMLQKKIEKMESRSRKSTEMEDKCCNSDASNNNGHDGEGDFDAHTQRMTPPFNEDMQT